MKSIRQLFENVRQWLRSLSFRTGVIVLMSCIPFYILSFAQIVLPISAAAKGILWTVLFGLAKTCQYGGLTILGVEGYKRFKNMLKRN
jgi:phosphoglycolate phosphatase